MLVMLPHESKHAEISAAAAADAAMRGNMVRIRMKGIMSMTRDRIEWWGGGIVVSINWSDTFYSWHGQNLVLVYWS